MTYFLKKVNKNDYFYLGDMSWEGVFNPHPSYNIVLYDKRLLYKKLLRDIAVNFRKDVTLSYFMDMAECITDWADDENLVFLSCYGEKELEGKDINYDLKQFL